MALPSKWTPLDRFGQPIDVSDLVIFESPSALTFKVLDIKPIMDRSVPPGSMVLVLETRTNIPIQGGSPVPPLIRIGYVDASGSPKIGSLKRGSAAPAQGSDAVRVPPVDTESEIQTPDPGPEPPAGPRLVT